MPLILAAPGEPEGSDLVDRLSGTYRHAGGQRDQEAVARAIDRVVSEMSFFVRGIARGRLEDAAAIAGEVSIWREGERVHIAFDNRDRAAVPGGPSVRVEGVNGETLDYELSVRGGALVQHFSGDRGGRITRIELDGDDLWVSVQMYSSQLPAPVEYKLRYRRADSAL